jgi:hypothetical protein
MTLFGYRAMSSVMRSEADMAPVAKFLISARRNARLELCYRSASQNLSLIPTRADGMRKHHLIIASALTLFPL